jgi:hypothetical protein
VTSSSPLHNGWPQGPPRLIPPAVEEAQHRGELFLLFLRQGCDDLYLLGVEAWEQRLDLAATAGGEGDEHDSAVLRALPALDEASALKGREDAAGGWPADPDGGGEVPSLHLTPDPEHPEGGEGGSGQTIVGEDRGLEVASEHGAAAEHIGDRPHGSEVEWEVPERRRRVALIASPMWPWT